MRSAGLVVLALVVALAFVGCSSGGDTGMMKCTGCSMEMASGDMCGKCTMCMKCDKCMMDCKGCKMKAKSGDMCKKCGKCKKCDKCMK